MNVEEYYAAVRLLDLHHKSGNTYVTGYGDVFYVQDPHELSPEDRVVMIKNLRALRGVED